MPSADDCTQKLLQTIPRFMRMLGGSMRRRFSDDEQLSFRHIHMLEILHHQPCNLRDLAQYHHVTSSTMSRSVDQLVKRQWVERQNNPDDRREIELHLTELGLQAYNTMASHSQDVVAELLVHLSDDERMLLSQGLDILQKMLAHTNKECERKQQL